MSKSRAATTTAAAADSKPSGQNIIRTIYLPNEHTDALAARVESLERQLQDQSQIASERVQALEKDRNAREEQYRAASKNSDAKIEQLEKALEFAQRSTRSAIKEYLELRHDAQVKQRELMESMARLESENASLRVQMDTLSDRLAGETEAIRSSIIEDGERQVQRFRKQTIMAEDQLIKEKQKNGRELRLARERIDELETKCALLKRKKTYIEQRRRLDFEGFERDIGAMRSSIRALEALVYAKHAKKVLLDDKPVAGTAWDNDDSLTYEQKITARKELLDRQLDHLREHIEQFNVEFPQAATKAKKKQIAKPDVFKRPAWVDR
jgi:myosin heavy subunit